MFLYWLCFSIHVPESIDIEKILEAAKKNNKILEINANPERLDLKDSHIKAAIEHRVKLAICTDAHDISNLDFMLYGVAEARRGFAEKKDIINTLSYDKLVSYFKR